MRVAIVIFENVNRDKLVKIAKSLSKGLESQGHIIDIVDGKRDVNTKITAYDYIAIGAEQASFFGGKIPGSITPFFENAGIVTGKRCFAFVIKKTFGSGKALSKLMKTIEHEGMYLKNSMIIANENEAEIIGQKLHVKKN